MNLLRARKLLALLAILLALYGCAAKAHIVNTELVSLLNRREQAVNDKNAELYLSTVLPSDDVLLKEETNLIRSAKGLAITGYKLSADNVRTNGDKLVALVTQSYSLEGKERRCVFDAQFTAKDGKLYYDGPDFLSKQNDKVKVCYTNPNADLAQKLLNLETANLQSLQQSLGFTPSGVITVKVFHDQPVFLQSVKLDLPSWVGGWHEYGESIKLFASNNAGDTFGQTLLHESIHRMVSELSRDNAAYWLQEGLAELFEPSIADLAHPLPLTTVELSLPFTAYTEQTNINLEQLDMNNTAAVTRYYMTSKAFASFLMDRYGWDKVRQMLEYMQKFDLLPVTGAEKLNETNGRTAKAMEQTLGLNSSQFQSGFDTWLADRVAK